jgi:hypothetical protein
MPSTQNATHVASVAGDFEQEASSQAAPAAAGPLVQSITREAARQMRRRLGLAERARLPDGIKHLIETAAKETVESALAVAVDQEVRATAKRMVRDSRVRSADLSSPSGLPLLDEGLSIRSVDISRPLLEKARGLAAEKHALEAAGFSSEDAMRILVAEIATGSY